MAISFSAGYDPTQPISWEDRATQGFKPRFRQPIPLSSPFSSVGADESYVGKGKVQPWVGGEKDTISKDATFKSGFSEPITRVTATPSGSGFFSPDGKSPITFARDFAVANAPDNLRDEVSATARTFETPFRRDEPSSSETSNTIDRAVSVSGDPTRGVSRTVETGKIERPKRPVHTPNRATQGTAPRPTVPSERATQGYRSPSTSIFNAIDRGVNEGINQERAGVEVAKASQGLGSRLVRNFSPGSEYLNRGYTPGATNIATKAGNISEDVATFTQLVGDDLSQVGKTAAGTGKWYPRNLQELGEMNPFQKGGAKGGIGWSFGAGSATGPTPLSRQVVKRTAASPVGRAISNVASTSAAKGAGKFLGKAVPVAGTSLAIWDAQNRFSEGDIVGGTLSGIGAIPAFGLPALGAQVLYDAVDGKGRLTRLGENIGDRVGDFLTRGTRADTARTLAEIEAMRTPEQIANTRDQYVDKMGNVKKGVTKDESGQATGFDTGVPQTYWEGGRQFEIQPEVYNPQGELQAPEGRTEITDPWSMENLQRKGLLDDGTLIASSLSGGSYGGYFDLGNRGFISPSQGQKMLNNPGAFNATDKELRIIRENLGLPQASLSGGEDKIAFWGGKKEAVVDPTKKQNRANDMNIINYVNSSGTMGKLPEGWTEEDARQYIRNRDAGNLQSFDIPGGEEVQIASSGDLTGLLSEQDPSEGTAEKGFLDKYIKDPEVDDSWKSELPGWISSPTMRPDGSVWGYNYSGGYGNVYKGGDMDAKHMGQEGTWGFNLDTDVDVPTPWEGKIWEGDLTGNAEESRKLVDDFDVEGDKSGTPADHFLPADPNSRYKTWDDWRAGVPITEEYLNSGIDSNKPVPNTKSDKPSYDPNEIFISKTEYVGGNKMRFTREYLDANPHLWDRVQTKGTETPSLSELQSGEGYIKNVNTGEQGFLGNYIKNPEGYDSNLDQAWKDYEKASEDEHAKIAKTRIEAGYDPGWRRGDEIWVNPEQARKDWEAEGAPAWGEVFEKGQPKIMDWPDDGYYDSFKSDKYTAEDFKNDKPTQSTDLPSWDQLQSGEGYIKNEETGEVTKIGGSKPGGVNTSSTTNLNPTPSWWGTGGQETADDWTRVNTYRPSAAVRKAWDDHEAAVKTSNREWNKGNPQLGYNLQPGIDEVDRTGAVLDSIRNAEIIAHGKLTKEQGGDYWAAPGEVFTQYNGLPAGTTYWPFADD